MCERVGKNPSRLRFRPAEQVFFLCVQFTSFLFLTLSPRYFYHCRSAFTPTVKRWHILAVFTSRAKWIALTLFLVNTRTSDNIIFIFCCILHVYFSLNRSGAQIHFGAMCPWIFERFLFHICTRPRSNGAFFSRVETESSVNKYVELRA